MNDEIKKMLNEILISVKSLESRVTQIESIGGDVSPQSSPSQVVSTQKKLSIKEFIIEHIPKNGVQTTLAIGYYLEHYEGLSPFNIADLEQGFRAAKEPVPKNISDKTGMNTSNGHLMEEKGKKNGMKAWVVTRSGEQYVENNFGNKK